MIEFKVKTIRKRRFEQLKKQYGFSSKRFTKVEDINNFIHKLNSKCYKSEIEFEKKISNDLRLKDKYILFHKNYSLLNSYFIDFLDCKNNIVIEIDGPSHDSLDRQERDKLKDHYLTSNGYKVFRIKYPGFNGYEELINHYLYNKVTLIKPTIYKSKKTKKSKYFKGKKVKFKPKSLKNNIYYKVLEKPVFKPRAILRKKTNNIL